MTTTEEAILTPKARLTVLICFLVAALEGYDLQVLSVAGPFLRKIMDISAEQLGIAFAASLFGLAIGAGFGGALADRWGRKKVLLSSVLGLGVFTLGTAFVHDFTSLMVMRTLTGVAIGGAMPNLIAIVASLSRPGRTTSLVAIMICGMPAGGVVVALSGHALVAGFGWPGLFAFGGLLTLIVAPLLIWGLTDSRPKPVHSHAPIAYGAVLFGENRAAATVLLWALFIVTLFILSLLTGWAPSLVISKGLPPSAGFSVMLALNVGGILGTLVIGRLCDTWGIRNALLAIYLGMAASLAAFAWTQNLSLLLPLAGVAGFFVLGAQFCLYGVAPRLYPAASYGAGVGAAVAAGRVGSILGPMFAGLLIGSGITGDNVILTMAPLALLGGAILVGLVAVSAGALLKPAPLAPDPALLDAA